MKDRGITLYIAGFLLFASVGTYLYFGSLNRSLKKHMADLCKTNSDMIARREGCLKSLEDMEKFEKHVSSYLEEKKTEIDRIKAQINDLRARIGNVEKIKEEYEKLEKELDEVNGIVSELEGMKGARKP